MTFREDMSAVSLCNRALSRVAQAPISSLDPPQPVGIASRECARWYRPVVARLLEMHHWGLATARVPLTATTNDRQSEWLYKYVVPNQVAFPVALSPFSGSSDVNYYVGLAGLLARIGGSPAFLLSGRNLYSRYQGDLDFVSYDITEADFNSTFANIVELTLVAAIAYAITKNRAREKELREQATSAINLAITQNLNAGRPTYGDEPSARDYARGSFAAGPGLSWDWGPGVRSA